MNEEKVCANCRFCEEYYETHYFCELFKQLVSGRGFCLCYVEYPKLTAL